MKASADVESWRSTLETVMEHASHAFGDLRRRGMLREKLPHRWPPEVANPVGDVSYHLSAMSMYLQRIYEEMGSSEDDC